MAQCSPAPPKYASVPKLSEAKVKGGIFVGPQVKRLVQSDGFFEKLSVVERRA